MWELDHKEGWAPKNWCFQSVVLEKTLASPLDSKEIKPVNPQWEYFVSLSLKEIYILSSFPTCEPLWLKPPLLISSGQLKLNIWQIHLCPQSPTNMGNCHPSASICFHFVLIPVICSHIATGNIIDNTLLPPRNVKRMDSMLACAPWDKAVTDTAHCIVLLFICVPQIL